MEDSINRRTFLKLSAVASVSTFAGLRFGGMNRPCEVHSPGVTDLHRFRIGDFDCTCINDGGANYRPEHFFKNVPPEQIEQALSERHLPADHIYTPYTHLVVNTGRHLVLVDMGAGNVIPNNGKLAPTMKSIGIEPGDIDTVFITHAHPDHVGGALDEQGKPVYATARYFIWKDEWDFWFSATAHELTNESFIKTARERLAPIKDRMNLVDREAEVLPGIRVLAAPGHTPGHMVVAFSSGGRQLYYIGDTVLHPLHLEHPDWFPIYDILPEKAALSKRKIFDLVAETKAFVIGQHFIPFPSLGHVLKERNAWQWHPVKVKI